MAKICTDIEQSKKLIELGLDVNTADMCWIRYKDKDTWNESCEVIDGTLDEDDIYAWSLSALLDIYPMIVGRDMDMYCCWQNKKNLHSRHYDNPIDACYEMIIKLHELNLFNHELRTEI